MTISVLKTPVLNDDDGGHGTVVMITVMMLLVTTIILMDGILDLFAVYALSIRSYPHSGLQTFARGIIMIIEQFESWAPRDHATKHAWLP